MRTLYYQALPSVVVEIQDEDFNFIYYWAERSSKLQVQDAVAHTGIGWLYDLKCIRELIADNKKVELTAKKVNVMMQTIESVDSEQASRIYKELRSISIRMRDLVNSINDLVHKIVE